MFLGVVVGAMVGLIESVCEYVFESRRMRLAQSQIAFVARTSIEGTMIMEEHH